MEFETMSVAAGTTSTTSPPEKIRWNDAVGVVWLVLFAATIASWFLGADHGLGEGDAAIVAVLVIGFAKAWVVANWFMELRTAPRLLRACFNGWLAITAITVIAMFVAM
jgi:caa(3)-type oxidase subunit IV